ncbi:MAG TPA: hypothetical protein VFN71_09190, partial [Methylomirabilota bacterium]|nr:hypothetical protein [Methylomirabilota bacterium]
AGLARAVSRLRDALPAVARLAETLGDRLRALDVNPLAVGPRGAAPGPWTCLPSPTQRRPNPLTPML